MKKRQFVSNGYCTPQSVKVRDEKMLSEIHEHFSDIAEQYSELRTTDAEPIMKIKDKMHLVKIKAADVGCGDGRYDLELFHQFGDRLELLCIDINEKMLSVLEDRLSIRKIENLKTKIASAENLPFENDSLDCIFTFNAIHHFDIFKFLKNASEALKHNGYLFIYTRLRSQNDRNIWGKYFPWFNLKESRLYELEELRNIFKDNTDLKLQSVDFFKFKRVSSLEQLVNKTSKHHYSTFTFYVKSEFEKGLEEFKHNLQKNFSDLENISWFDENVLLTLRNDIHAQKIHKY